MREDLFLWSTQQRHKVVPLTGPFVQKKALIFYEEFAEGEFYFTVGGDWVYK